MFGSYPSYFCGAFTVINFLKSLNTAKSITTWFVSMVLYVYGKQLIPFIPIKTDTRKLWAILLVIHHNWISLNQIIRIKLDRIAYDRLLNNAKAIP